MKDKQGDDYKKVRTFLKDLTITEFHYLELTVQLASSIKSLIKRHKLDKKRFCELFHINPKRYNDYTTGNFNYSVNDMATLNAVYQQLETEKLKEEDLIRIGGIEKFE